MKIRTTRIAIFHHLIGHFLSSFSISSSYTCWSSDENPRKVSLSLSIFKLINAEMRSIIIQILKNILSSVHITKMSKISPNVILFLLVFFCLGLLRRCCSFDYDMPSTEYSHRYFRTTQSHIGFSAERKHTKKGLISIPLQSQLHQVYGY